MRIQSAVPYRLAPSVRVSRFSYLTVEERRPAHLSYEFFSDTIANRYVLPSRVWFDLDDTLIRPRKVKDPIIFQGAIVGAMRAFSERAFLKQDVDVGIFSFWGGVAIWNLLDDCPYLGAMVARDGAGTPLIRGVDHINGTAMSLAAPENGVHAVLNEENGVIYFDAQHELTDDKCRSMKIIGRDEMLIDNDDVDAAYWNIALHFAPTMELWQKSRLAKAIDVSTKGYLGLDDSKTAPVPKFLSEREMDHALKIFNRLEGQHGLALS